MKPLNTVLGLSLLLSGAVLAEDIKCYAELANGQLVVLHGSMTDSSPQAVHEKFKQRGYEIDGTVQPVKTLLECRPLGETFQSKEGQRQDARQLR
ncbi:MULTISPECIES: TapY2 family type IVa secretion system protein [Aeromonas]|uniref:TapY2 family type IVa secretion system protein n=1 Tax=Aeromonas TaxID=642 RepID=UPI0015DC43F4|nr:TapY2 family type IVa secretion system protein [Aeromonas veronii]BBU03269.1 hypothetical protein WP9W18E04_06080 [Aeromonas veronii]